MFLRHSRESRLLFLRESPLCLLRRLCLLFLLRSNRVFCIFPLPVLARTVLLKEPRSLRRRVPFLLFSLSKNRIRLPLYFFNLSNDREQRFFHFFTHRQTGLKSQHADAGKSCFFRSHIR